MQEASVEATQEEVLDKTEALGNEVVYGDLEDSYDTFAESMDSSNQAPNKSSTVVFAEVDETVEVPGSLPTSGGQLSFG